MFWRHFDFNFVVAKGHDNECSSFGSLKLANIHGLVRCVRSHGIQTEASQLAGLHLASGIQSSRMKSRRVVSQSKIAQDGAQTLKLHSIQKEATRIVCVLLTSNAKKSTSIESIDL